MWRAIRKYSTKPFYVTSPIFYVNASPHLGHAYSMLLCDTRARWERLNPEKSSYLLTGTDEHGLKIQAAAEKRGVDPKQLVDEVSQNFKFLALKLNIGYDRFIRTTDSDHMETVRYFWDLMKSKGLIYEGSHSGWYSISDETFYPENQIMEVTENGVKKMIAKESRTEVIFQEENNYFFKLSQFQDQLIQHMEENPDFVVPKSKYNTLLAELKLTKLSDLSISRPSSRLKWSIEVPNDPSQKIYVWLDALLNYLTAAGFPNTFNKTESSFETQASNIWPATHVVGKDIIKFHCVYWPIFLMAAGVQLPTQVIVHSHWLSEGFKMSKSLGNVVDPIATQDYYGEDALRFFLSEYSNIETDCNFSEAAFSLSRDTLIGKYANLVTRCGGAKFNIEQSVEFYEQGQYEGIDDLITKKAINPEAAESIIKLGHELKHKLDSLYLTMDKKMAQFDQMKAIQEWWSVIELANVFFQTAEPWLYSKKLNDDKAYQILQNYYVFLAAESSRICSILISAIIPNLAGKILDRLGVDASKRSSHNARVGGDITYGKNANSKKHKIPIERVPTRE
ncbi:uncharacterized protein CANTADRAFT_53477 [Suhomyces tanzawaensis NRRL Y-17324]|uniref:Methionine--tRNA ligase, mitochondrial n=1 Tax=Suhomyces tanzawaensis NRRL Y-17324 TaxID=984487 RepID=A0A1E4SGT1_9ASCO|nr:uncharacterized protein CANTADRAFT_53477 [Suhomyces tanzawaensis NRRL Y-17324]ODV78714.1 hypothetical protein CANTADRAFT_53477 [Suhomyces tanzawaensis NRRL Y-17324]